MVWLREDPRFFVVLRDGGMVDLRAVRGDPLGCRRVRDVAPERLSWPAHHAAPVGP
jgi:hypothetical protein